MDASTITLLAGIISCIIGVSTFVTGRMAKAEHNGSMETKINQALEGIADISNKLERLSNDHHETDLLVRSHEEKIATLFHQQEEIRKQMHERDETNRVLSELVQVIKTQHCM